MTVTLTELELRGNKITCMVNQVESGSGIFYYGTDKGHVHKYNNVSKTDTTLADLHQEILSMSLYSNTLYIGLASGDFVKLTTS